MNRGGKLTLPFPPSVNGYWRSIPAGRGGTRQIISEKGRLYRLSVMKYCYITGARNAGLAGRLRVAITIYPPDRRTRDIDNYAKAILDGLTAAGVWMDDEQIDDLRLVRGPKRRGGGAIVEIVEDPVHSPLDRDIGSGYA